MRISVTEQDIKDGRPCSSISCPVVYAIKRHLNAKDFSIVVGDIHISLNGIHYNTPNIVKQFIQEFDSGFTSVTPFEFELGEPINENKRN